MRSSASPVARALVLSAATGLIGFGLLACEGILGDFTVQPGAADGSFGVDSSQPVVEGGSQPEAGGMDAATDGDAGVMKTHCDSVVAPPGAANFLCADFDAPKLVKNWDDLSLSDAGTADKTNNVAVSLPFSFITNARGFGGMGFLSWGRVGAMRFSEATAHFHINPGMLGGVAPPSTGTLVLAHITTSNASLSFGYSRGSTEFGVSGGPYTGYFLYNAAFGGAAALNRYMITAIQLMPDVWTDVKLIWGSDGKIQVLYNDLPAITAFSGFGSNDTMVKFQIGANANGDVGAMPNHRLDDVELSIRR